MMTARDFHGLGYCPATALCPSNDRKAIEAWYAPGNDAARQLRFDELWTPIAVEMAQIEQAQLEAEANNNPNQQDYHK